MQFRTLYRDFLFRMIDLEILSSHAQGDATTLLGQFLSLLVLVSFVFAVAANIFANAKVPTQVVLYLGWTGEHTLIATTMLVVGIFAVLSWDSTFPDRRDVMVLAPLPVRARTLFAAKVAAVSTALGLTILTLHVLAGLAWPVALNAKMPGMRTLSCTTDPALPPVQAPELQTMLDREFANADVMETFLAPGSHAGVTIGVVRHGVRRVFAYGAAKPDSIFEIGSISKTFTALILARMVEEGRVKLEDPVRGLLPAGSVRRPAGNEIRLIDLATHRSGLPRMPNNVRFADGDKAFADYNAAKLYAFMAYRGVGKPENPQFAYSNLGFGLLGQVLADREGRSYPELLKEQVTEPLGLRDTGIELSPEQLARVAQGHDGEHRPAHPLVLEALAGAGAIRSTADDMLTYLEAQLHPERVPALAAAIRNTHRLRAEVMPGAAIGLSWFYNVPISSRVFWHDGATFGYTGVALFKPNDDYALVVLSNTSGVNGIGFAEWLSEHVRQRLAGEPAFSFDSVAVPPGGGFLSLVRMYAAYWFTMLACGVFMMCCVLSAQGIAAQVLPRRLYLRSSSWLQMGSFCLVVSVYFLQPKLTDPLTLVSAQGGGLLAWSPSYWFLGLFQELNGSPALSILAQRAWLGLGISVGTTAVAYALSYFRTLRLIVEEPDIVPGSRGIRWLPNFGQSMATAVVQFSVRTLLRSRQHRIILAFYLGIGFATAIFFMVPPASEPELAMLAAPSPWREVSIPLLASTILMLGFWIVGNRVVFSLPLDLKANWIFRITPVRGGSNCLSARRRALWIVALLPFWSVCAALMLTMWPWRPALGHLVVLVLLGLTVAELCLSGPQKIPFTCSWLPGKSNVHITFWIAILLVIVGVTKGAELELHALGDAASYRVMILILCAAAMGAWIRTAMVSNSDEEVVQFEEVPAWHILTLDLPRDGGLVRGPGNGTLK